MRSKTLTLYLLLLALILFTHPASAQQSDEVRLNVRRSFGFSSGAQIRGTFSLDVVGSVSISSVKYFIDGNLMAEVAQAPFGFTFQTTSYSNGWHELYAEVKTIDNRTLRTAIRKYEFVSSEVEGQAVTGIVFPLLGAVVLITLIGVLSQILVFKRKGLNNLPYGAPRNFGMMGGTVCPKCKRVFSIHWWGINAVAGKFDRCDFCGKWSIVRRMSQSDLQSAIQAELELSKPDMPAPTKTSTDKLKEAIDDSKYTDL